MRSVWPVLFLCCLLLFPQAESRAEQAVSWQAFRLPQETAAPAPPANGALPGQPVLSPADSAKPSLLPAPEHKAPAPSTFLVALTVTPPHGTYHYGVDSSLGLPTTVQATAYALGKNGAPAQQGADLVVLAPEAVPKRFSTFASVVQTGVEDKDAPIYPGPATFIVTVPIFPDGVSTRVAVQALFCSATSCTPLQQEFDISFMPDAIQTLPLASEAPWWASWQTGAPVPAPAASKPDAHNAKVLSPEQIGAFIASYGAFEPRYFNPALEVQELGEALLFGLFAGLLLNLMPCVLPVVSLKFSALLAVTAMTNKQEQARAFRVHCLLFALGVITWFMILAVMLGVAGWAWGGMFQSPQVIAGLGFILFLLGLSLFNVFTLPIFDLKVESESHPHWQAFGSGLLATLLATPCSGPLLGGVLGWAIRQPLHVLGLTIACIGFGMALPYVCMAFSPRLVHLLPRPGAWTGRLEQILGFFLMASVVYLTTLLPPEWVSPFLFNLMALAFAAWLWGQVGHLGASRLMRGCSRGAAAVLVGLSLWWGAASLQQDFSWEPFDPAQFSTLLGKEPLFVEFTADWCPSCKALEHTTLNKKRMATLRSRYNMRTIRVDLTRNDKAGQALLEALGSTSIPVLALFPQGEGAKQPVILRDIVTPRQLKNALRETFR